MRHVITFITMLLGITALNAQTTAGFGFYTDYGTHGESFKMPATYMQLRMANPFFGDKWYVGFEAINSTHGFAQYQLKLGAYKDLETARFTLEAAGFTTTFAHENNYTFEPVPLLANHAHLAITAKLENSWFELFTENIAAGNRWFYILPSFSYFELSGKLMPIAGYPVRLYFGCSEGGSIYYEDMGSGLHPVAYGVELTGPKYKDFISMLTYEWNPYLCSNRLCLKIGVGK